jgi:PBSX family phage portal protein
MAIKIEVKEQVKLPEKTQKAEPKTTFMPMVIGGDTYLVLSQSKVELEDEFASLYYTTQNQSNIFLMPPFDPQVLLNFVQTNNVLNQCIEAMEVNVDATGHEFVPSEEAAAKIEKKQEEWKAQQIKKQTDRATKVADYHSKLDQANHQFQTGATMGDDATPVPVDWPPPLAYEPKLPDPEFGTGIDPEELIKAKAFFNEPYPNLSFSKIRRKLRRELESVGYAYLEILRNLEGEIVGLRNIETHQTRMVKLDAPIMVEKTISRNGKDVKLQMWERQRRFAQRVALKQLVYYREFGTARHVDRNNGKWDIPATGSDSGYQVAIENRGTELIVFGIHPDVTTPYFLPRWINELPSVIGNRKAEELNLEFLDSGGMPPAIIFVQGGTLAKDASDQLKMYLSGKNKNKHRAVVVEAQSSSGSLESAGTVQVKVERFGAERAMDAMFTKYDAQTEEHIRVGFRIPPLFLGKAADYNFATAQTAYMVAEEQVFQPERNAFDEQINSMIIRTMGFKTLRFKSNPVTLASAADQINAMTQAKGTVTNESFVEAIEEITGFELEPQQQQQPPGDPQDQPPPKPGMMPKGPSVQGGAVGTAGNISGASDSAGALQSNTGTAKYAREGRSATELIDLAQDYMAMKGLTKKRDLGAVRQAQVTVEVSRLTKAERRAFDSLVAISTYGQDDPDLVRVVAHAHRR